MRRASPCLSQGSHWMNSGKAGLAGAVSQETCRLLGTGAESVRPGITEFWFVPHAPPGEGTPWSS